jgi:hypothetical protein
MGHKRANYYSAIKFKVQLFVSQRNFFADY